MDATALVKLCFLLRCGAALQAWSAPGESAPDSLPTVDIRLAPPIRPLPEIAAEISSLDKARERLESDMRATLQETFDQTLGKAKESIEKIVWASVQPAQQRKQDASFLQAEENTSARASDEHAFALKVNVLPAELPHHAGKEKMRSLEEKQSNAENDMLKQACTEMQALTDIILYELGVQLSEQMAAQRLFSTRVEPTAFYKKSKDRLRGLPPMANVRIASSSEAFPTIADMVMDMEARRGEAEQTEKQYIIDLELKLVKAETEMIRQALGSAAKVGA